ncbi:MAG: hypothetical protein QM579_03830 [Desulfovibrio sp.]|uniref:hypothetical protein n=1 Tax=Desulfovibrio sp. TaxID=885 RepID=UPI0039E293F2
MPTLIFSKWSPGGNTTLLFPSSGLAPSLQSHLARQALSESCLGGEQAGYVDVSGPSLRMAGGEFCVNASRAMGAMLACDEACLEQPGDISCHCPDCEQQVQATDDSAGATASAGSSAMQRLYEVSVSGWPSLVQLYVRGRAPHWLVEARLRLPEITIQRKAEGIHLVRLPGICHLLLDGHIHNQPEDCHAAAALLRERHELEQEEAVGVIWWRVLQGQLNMLPIVHVRDTRTDYLESACGSGALALALSRSQAGGGNAFSIMQPSGSSLDVRLFSENGVSMAGVDGPVTLVAKGQVWLPDMTD